MVSGRVDARGSFARVTAFLREVGVASEIDAGATGDSGISVEGGRILFARADDALSGEALRAAGCIALVPGRFRSAVRDGAVEAGEAMDRYVAGARDDVDEDPVLRACLQAGRSEAAAWAYAAAAASGVDTRLPFRSGPRGSGADTHVMLSLNAHGGINGLQAAGMTSVRARPGRPAFPAMTRWLAVD